MDGSSCRTVLIGANNVIRSMNFFGIAWMTSCEMILWSYDVIIRRSACNFALVVVLHCSYSLEPSAVSESESKKIGFLRLMPFGNKLSFVFNMSSQPSTPEPVTSPPNDGLSDKLPCLFKYLISN